VRLEARDVTGGYAADALVLHGVSLGVGASEIVALLGRNGVGKSTLLRALMGLLPNASGDVLVDGKDVSRRPTHERARSGLAYVPQGRDLFSRSSVEQNLRYGHLLAGRGMRAPLPQGVFDAFPWLSDRSQQLAGTLSGGEQQMVAIARVLVGGPTVLLLDEPAEGLAPIMVQRVAQTIRDIAATSTLAILLVEQNVGFALDLATRGYVMEKGSIVAEGSAEELGSEQILSRYLSV
jgi:urea transport system ATP-binding protein